MSAAITMGSVVAFGCALIGTVGMAALVFWKGGRK